MSTVSMEGAVPVSWAEAAEVLVRLKRRCGLDFSEYRRDTVRRRIHNHLVTTRASGFADYLRLLEESPGEAQQLVERITIKVSRFYRNAVTFDALRQTVLPELGRADRPLHIWSAGCGRGEEPYTLAMLLEELDLRGEVRATDIDHSALAAAGEGLYLQDSTAELPDSLRRRYLQTLVSRNRMQLQVVPALRKRVRFQAHDLLVDAPAASEPCYDLICCRNVLIYLQPAAQLRVLSRLCAQLRPGGYLCLGEAEWPPPELAMRLQALQRATRLFRVIA